MSTSKLSKDFINRLTLLYMDAGGVPGRFGESIVQRIARDLASAFTNGNTAKPHLVAVENASKEDWYQAERLTFEAEVVEQSRELEVQRRKSEIQQREQAQAPAATPIFRRVSNVESESVSWLWHPRIPFGKLTIIGGDPGVGKGFVTAAITAAVTRGTALPDTQPVAEWEPQSDTFRVRSAPRQCEVLIASYEDGPEDTIRPRLEAAGADLEKVLLLDQLEDEDGRPRNFEPGDLPFLEKQLAESGACVLIIDPVGSYVPGQADTHRDNHVRGILQPLADFAKRVGVAVILVMHLNKSEMQKVLYRVSGSVGFVGLARSVLIVGEDFETKKKGLAHVKSNLALQAETLEFTLTTVNLPAVGGVGRLDWVGVNTDLTPEKLLSGAALQGANPGEDTSKREACAADLKKLLAEGPVRAGLCQKALMEAGHSERTISRAKKLLDVQCRKVPKKEDPSGCGYWEWSISANFAETEAK